jgi:hypothetical protein
MVSNDSWAFVHQLPVVHADQRPSTINAPPGRLRPRGLSPRLVVN